MARTSEYNKELTEEICDLVREGGHIKKILASDKERYPSFPTWCRWKRENKEMFNLYVGAMQDKSESVLEKIDDLEEKVASGELNYSQGHLLINTLKWKAAKFYPKMYGTRAELDITTGGNEIPQQVTVFQLPDNNREKLDE